VVAPFPIPACRVALANAGLRQGTPFPLAPVSTIEATSSSRRFAEEKSV
jgi:hypothetical protein